MASLGATTSGSEIVALPSRTVDGSFLAVTPNYHRIGIRRYGLCHKTGVATRIEWPRPQGPGRGVEAGKLAGAENFSEGNVVK